MSHYWLYGIDGLGPKRSAYSVQFKLQVLSHQDREQLSSRQVGANTVLLLGQTGQVTRSSGWSC